MSPSKSCREYAAGTSDRAAALQSSAAASCGDSSPSERWAMMLETSSQLSSMRPMLRMPATSMLMGGLRSGMHSRRLPPACGPWLRQRCAVTEGTCTCL